MVPEMPHVRAICDDRAMATGSGSVRPGRRPSQLQGCIVPGEAAYDDRRRTFNGLLDRRPAGIMPCTTVDDVLRAVDGAANADLPVSIRGGGHSVTGHGVGDGALVVDLSAMRSVTVDAGRKLARVQGGALWDDVDAATQAHGLAVPGGTYGDTGVGGLTLGGGLGWLLGTAGLTCDNLVRAQVVTSAGELVVAGDDGDPELLWALRGGGATSAWSRSSSSLCTSAAR